MADSLSSVTGLTSGIDYRALVDAIIAAERRPAIAAEAQIDLATRRKDALGTWRSLLTTLRTTLDALRDGKGLGALVATQTGQTATGRALFTATAAPGAVQGSYSIEVISLARAEKVGGQPVADVTAALGLEGDFSLNGTTITVGAEDSLTAIRDRINAANTGATPTRVSASILTVGPGDNRLILTSQVAGAAGIARVDGAGNVLAALGLAGDSAVLVEGTDARFTVDGVELTRTTNVIAEAIPGVTLTLASEAPGSPGTLEVTRDGEAAVASAQAFVDAYNAAVQFLKAQSTPGTPPPPLYGDSSLRLARASLAKGLLGIIGGDEGNAVSGSSAGFSLSKTGTLSLDKAKFAASHAGSFDQLQSLFASGSGGLDLDGTLDAALLTNTGTLDMKTTFLTERITALQDRVAQIDSRLERRRASLLQQFVRMEATLGALQSQASFLASQAAGFNRQRSS